MRRSAFLLIVPLLVLVGCGSSNGDHAQSTTTQSPKATTATKTPETPTSFAVDISSTTSPKAATATTAAPNSTGGPTGKILMLKLHVGDDLAAAGEVLRRRLRRKEGRERWEPALTSCPSPTVDPAHS